MLPRVVVVEPLSQFSDSPCRTCHVARVALPFCQSCHALQDCPIVLDPFGLFGLMESLNLDENQLKEKWYHRIRELHPDKFSQKSPQELRYAVLWTSAVNKAYATLKTLEQRASYLIQKYFPVEPNSKQSIPFDLAESYFELQDLLESPEKTEQIKTFENQIEVQISEVKRSKVHLAESWDSTTKENHPALLKEFKTLLVKERYLQSMKEDIDKKVRG